MRPVLLNGPRVRVEWQESNRNVLSTEAYGEQEFVIDWVFEINNNKIWTSCVLFSFPKPIFS